MCYFPLSRCCDCGCCQTCDPSFYASCVNKTVLAVGAAECIEVARVASQAFVFAALLIAVLWCIGHNGSVTCL